MHEVLVNRLGGLSLPRKSVVRLTDRPDMTLGVYCGRKTTIQQYNNSDNGINSLSTETKIAEFANSVDFDEVAHNEPPHQDLHCLPSSL